MTQDFKKETVVLQSNPEDKIINFLNDLRNLLDKHKAKLYSSDCELYLDNIGYVGSLEDNIDCVEITDGYNVLYSSLK
tara:strand:- start:275 stop:508 length:234 start_codon:yes stop_codon:yes gene_type:complete